MSICRSDFGISQAIETIMREDVKYISTYVRAETCIWWKGKYLK